MIDLYRFRHKSGKYLCLTKDLKYELTENRYEGLTFDSWDSASIQKRCGINDLTLEHINNRTIQFIYNNEVYKFYLVPKYITDDDVSKLWDKYGSILRSQFPINRSFAIDYLLNYCDARAAGSPATL